MERILRPNMQNSPFFIPGRLKKNPYRMIVRISVALCFLFGIGTSAMSQQIKLDITKDSTLVNGNYSYSISITIKGGTPPFNIEVYDNFLKEGGKLIAKEYNFNQSVVSFSNFTANKHLFISVESIEKKQGVTTLIRL
jgi:hypothetical protein